MRDFSIAAIIQNPACDTRVIGFQIVIESVIAFFAVIAIDLFKFAVAAVVGRLAIQTAFAVDMMIGDIIFSLITEFIGIFDAVTACFWPAGIARGFADKARFHGRAVCGTSVAILCIAIVANFFGFQFAVAANDYGCAGLACFGTCKAIFYLATICGTAIAIGSIAVIAGFVGFHLAVAADSLVFGTFPVRTWVVYGLFLHTI